MNRDQDLWSRAIKWAHENTNSQIGLVVADGAYVLEFRPGVTADDLKKLVIDRLKEPK